MENGYVFSIFGRLFTFFGAGDCDWRAIVQRRDEKNDIVKEVLDNCINQWGVDTNVPKME